MHLVATIIALVVFGKAFMIATAVCFIIWLANPTFFNPSTPHHYHPPIVVSGPPSTPKVETEETEEHKMFMQDCMAVMDNDKKYCNDVWFDRVVEEDRLVRSGNR